MSLFRFFNYSINLRVLCGLKESLNLGKNKKDSQKIYICAYLRKSEALAKVFFCGSTSSPRT
ncbi:MAG: hypothetical protein MUP68_00250, partial [Deltaproteobacteria bacterium]|nr:hypothetical protein [Deltaproteobacteria bacterium]